MTFTYGERWKNARVWTAAVVGGLVGGIGMGLTIDLSTGSISLLGAVYGQPSVFGGWLVHLFNSVIFALVFAALVTFTPVREYARSADGVVGLGLGYGALLGLVTGGVVLPLALNAVGAATLPVPLLPLPGFVGPFAFGVVLAIAHLIYGVLLGSVFAAALGLRLAHGEAEVEPVSNH